MNAFTQLIGILDLDRMGFPIQETTEYLYSTCLSMLKAASKTNKYGFQALICLKFQP
jgi:hypothetical protein